MSERKLWKTTIVVWSCHNPHTMESSELVRDGEDGESWIESSDSAYVDVPDDFENMQFFFPEHDDGE